jgi:hypothetical protein
MFKKFFHKQIEKINPLNECEKIIIYNKRIKSSTFLTNKIKVDNPLVECERYNKNLRKYLYKPLKKM